MTEDELRALVRETIARIKGSQNPLHRLNAVNPGTHASHALFAVTPGADESGPCIIEPAVPCSHCGYCKSLGH
jgi:hypothetical protein